MKKNYFLAALLIAVSLSTFANEAEEILNNDSYKYQNAKKIFEQLIEAKGDKRMQVPNFIMSKKKRYVAWMDNKKSQIGLEEAAYDVCITFGEDSLNALAALIGHEVTHYYEKHSWGNDFATAFTDLDVSRTVKSNTKSLDMKTTNETEADYLGGFLAYSAGYQTFGIMPRLLVDVYTEYGLPDEIVGYPSLDDRSKLAVESEMKLEELIHVFDAANYMIVLQQHETVNEYYSYILKEFQSREVYNNAGVNAILAAMQLFDRNDEQLKYAYPIQLDNETRMTKPKVRGEIYGFAEREEKRNQLLEQARFYFKQAYALDTDYATALINIACVEDLMENYDDADYFAKKALKVAKKVNNLKAEGDAYIIRGIAALHNQEKDDGIEYLSKASEKSESCKILAQLNVDIFSGNTPFPSIPKPKLSLSKEKLDNVSLDAFLESIDVDILLDIKKDLACGVRLLDESKILINLINGGQSGYTLLHVTRENYDGESGEGIKIGTFSEDVLIKYGQPTHTQQTTNGQYMVYDFKQIAFHVKNGRVESWALYRVQDDE
jgi:hypothetical protein